VSSWIEHGETVQIIKRGRAFASLTGVGAGPSNPSFPKPDIMAQLKEVWGDRMFSMDEVRTMREAELAEDQA
jgi:antitoxin (DNA-binding transcriptional repressor) of toxin-antitoxin stability system